MRYKSTALIWGFFLLLAAFVVLYLQFVENTRFNAGSVVACFLALIFLCLCLVKSSFAPLPIPLAVLYIALQTPLQFYYITPWALILASLLATIGLGILLPGRKQKVFDKINISGCTRENTTGKNPYERMRSHTGTSDNDNDNDPVINVRFGAVSRRIVADCLKTAQISCNFGALEVFFDHAKIDPEGAEINVNCNFGSIELHVTRDWRIIDKVNCTMGALEVDRRFAETDANAPQLILAGNISCGGIDIRAV